MFGFLKLPKTSHTVGFAFKCVTRTGQRTVWGVLFNTNFKAQ